MANTKVTLYSRDDDSPVNLYFPDIPSNNVGGVHPDLATALSACGITGQRYDGYLMSSSGFASYWKSQRDVIYMTGIDKGIETYNSISGDFSLLSQNGYYVSNGNYFKVTGTRTMEIYDSSDTLIASYNLSTASGSNFKTYKLPDTIEASDTLSTFRSKCREAGINPYTWRSSDPSDPGYYIPARWQGGRQGYNGLDNTIDFIYYLFHNPNADYTFDTPSDDPYAGDDGPYRPSGPGGGGGTRPPYDKGDPLPYWGKPPISICDTGLITLYTPSAVQLNLLASDIWSSNFVSSLVKDVYADPIEVIISVGIVPFNVTAAGTKKIKVGERELDISSNYPADNYVIYDMGTVALDEALGAYTDYAPYTKGEIYIPYVGFVPLDVDVFMGHDIGLKYMVDLCTGSATACLLVDDDVHQVFNCNLITPIPLTSANYSQMWQSLLSVTASLAGAGITAGGLAGATAAGEAAQGGKALQAGAAAASDIMTGISTKPTIQKSNSLAASGGLVGCPYAFVQIEHPALAIPADQNQFLGYPSYINSKLGSLKGYTRVSSIHLGIPGATKRELVDIENTLKNGFIIKESGAVTATGIGLLSTGDAPNVIGKSMTLIADLVGHFRAEVDIVNPVVTIEKASAVGFNYVYIADFGRYYFVDEVRAVRNGILELHLSCDPLESFRTAILGHNAIVDKQENQWNLYLNDDSIKSYQYPLIWQKKFSNPFWENYEFVLITAGA